MRHCYLAVAVILISGSWAVAEAPVVQGTPSSVTELSCAPPSHPFRDRLRRLFHRGDEDTCDEATTTGGLHQRSGATIPASAGSDKQSWWVPNLFGISGYSTFPGTAPVNLSGNGW